MPGQATVMCTPCTALLMDVFACGWGTGGSDFGQRHPEHSKSPPSSIDLRLTVEGSCLPGTSRVWPGLGFRRAWGRSAANSADCPVESDSRTPGSFVRFCHRHDSQGSLVPVEDDSPAGTNHHAPPGFLHTASSGPIACNNPHHNAGLRAPNMLRSRISLRFPWTDSLARN